jgi:hypothetical protein
MAIDSVSVPRALNQILPAGGPDILQRQDIPQIFGRICDREPVIINPPLVAFDVLRGAIGFLQPEAQKGLGTLRTLLGNEFFCTPEEVARLEEMFAFKLESLESFLRRYIGS